MKRKKQYRQRWGDNHTQQFTVWDLLDVQQWCRQKMLVRIKTKITCRPAVRLRLPDRVSQFTDAKWTAASQSHLSKHQSRRANNETWTGHAVTATLALRDVSRRYITGQIAAGEYATLQLPFSVHPAYSIANRRRSAVHAAVSSTSSVRHVQQGARSDSPVRGSASRRASVQPRSAVRGGVALWRSTEYQILCWQPPDCQRRLSIYAEVLSSNCWLPLRIGRPMCNILYCIVYGLYTLT